VGEVKEERRDALLDLCRRCLGWGGDLGEEEEEEDVEEEQEGGQHVLLWESWGLCRCCVGDGGRASVEALRCCCCCCCCCS